MTARMLLLGLFVAAVLGTLGCSGDRCGKGDVACWSEHMVLRDAAGNRVNTVWLDRPARTPTGSGGAAPQAPTLTQQPAISLAGPDASGSFRLTGHDPNGFDPPVAIKLVPPNFIYPANDPARFDWGNFWNPDCGQANVGSGPQRLMWIPPTDDGLVDFNVSFTLSFDADMPDSVPQDAFVMKIAVVGVPKGAAFLVDGQINTSISLAIGDTIDIPVTIQNPSFVASGGSSGTSGSGCPTPPNCGSGTHQENCTCVPNSSTGSGGGCGTNHHYEPQCSKCCLNGWVCCSSFGGPLDCNPSNFCG